MGGEAIKRRPVAVPCTDTVPNYMCRPSTPLDTCPDSRAGRADSQPFIYHSPDPQKRRHPVTFPKIQKEFNRILLIQGHQFELGSEKTHLNVIF